MRHLLLACLFALPVPAFAQTAQRLWVDNCLKCHGENGEGGGAGTRTLLTPEKRAAALDRAFFDVIKKGSPENGMEAFDGALSDPQMWALVNYIRELQAKDHRAKVGKPRPVNGVYTTQHAKYRVETLVASGLDVPWAVDFMPDGGVLVTERPGMLRNLKGGKLGEPIKNTPQVRNQGQGGLMDVALHPKFAENGWVYLAFAEAVGAGGRNGFTHIVRGKIKDGAWTDQQTIFRADEEDYSGGGVHFGCHIVFDGKGHVFFGIGERGIGPRSQDLDRPNGKVYRVNEDGTIPSDNPFVGKAKYGAIWSFGHRNPQGLVFDLHGNLWDTEHGPRGGDELNLIEKGRNYGWPLVSYGINYNGMPLVTPWADVTRGQAEGKDIAMPVDRWLPSIGACGLDVVHDGMFAAWKGDLLAGGLSGANVDRVRLKKGEKGWEVAEREEVLFGMGRVRDVRCAPDGSIYVVLNGPDRIIRLVAAP